MANNNLVLDCSKPGGAASLVPVTAEQQAQKDADAAAGAQVEATREGVRANRATIEAAIDAAMATLQSVIDAPAATVTSFAQAQTAVRDCQQALRALARNQRRLVRLIRNTLEATD